MGLDMVHYTTEKNPQNPPLQHAIFVQIHNSRHYTGVNVQMDLVFEVSDLGMCFKFQTYLKIAIHLVIHLKSLEVKAML